MPDLGIGKMTEDMRPGDESTQKEFDFMPRPVPEQEELQASQKESLSKEGDLHAHTVDKEEPVEDRVSRVQLSKAINGLEKLMDKNAVKSLNIRIEAEETIDLQLLKERGLPLKIRTNGEDYSKEKAIDHLMGKEQPTIDADDIANHRRIAEELERKRKEMLEKFRKEQERQYHTARRDDFRSLEGAAISDGDADRADYYDDCKDLEEYHIR